jgi:uncharacterized protein
MNWEQKYLKYKSKYLALKQISKTNQLTGGNKKTNLKTKYHFNKMIGGYKPYIEALSDIFAKFAGTSPETSIQSDTELLKQVLEEKQVSPCHGIEHAKTVMYHAWCALEEYELSDEDQLAVLLAALLHDADDGKFFPDHKNYENLRNILKQTGKSNDFIEDVVFMVSIVSASKNGDRIPRCVRDKPWMLIPRYADRIEAIGIIGVERCYTYTKNVSKLPLYLEDSPRPKTEEEIWALATEERYNNYKGKSVSMIDHYYDKLLRLSTFPISNKYFDAECAKRRKPLIDFLLYFGRKGSITHEEVEEFIREHSAPIAISDE